LIDQKKNRNKNMQSQHFNQLAQEAQALAAEREDLLEIFYQQGKAAFQRALASGFEDKLALKESGDAFFRMLQQDEEDYRPHLFLGYFLMLMDDYEQSEAFLKRAQELNGDRKEIPQLLKTLAEQKELPQFKSVDLTQPLQRQNPDLDLLYSECEAVIQQRFKTVSAVPGSSALDPAELAILKNRLLALERFWEIVQPVLDFMAPHFDLDSLESLAAPLRSQQKQLISAYGQSETADPPQKRAGDRPPKPSVKN
jgi:tetratricopeptide (TPR) repeat protein